MSESVLERTTNQMEAGQPAHLVVTDLRASYDNQVVLHGIDIDVPAGSCTSILGANGAGKTTLMNSIAGLHRSIDGRIELDGVDLRPMLAHQIAKIGVCYIPEGRGVFPDLTVAENLRLSIGRDAGAHERVMGQFPLLRALTRRAAGSLSGGEQQMLAMAPAVAGGYRLLLLDELSLGLAPIIVAELFDLLDEIRDTGVSMLLIEQFAERALEVSERAYVIRKGRVVYDGPSEALRGDDERLHELYMGSAAEGAEHHLWETDDDSVIEVQTGGGTP